MAATTINSYSDELTAQRANGTVAGGWYNSRRWTKFSHTTLASQATGEDIAVLLIPKGSKILGGKIAASAALANSAQLSVGLMAVDGSGQIDDAVEAGLKTDGTAVSIGTPVSDSTTCLKAAAVQSTTQVPFAITIALGYGYVTKKDLYLTLTTSVGTVATELVMVELDILVP